MLNFAYIYWAYFGVAKRTNVKQKKQKNPNPNPTLKIFDVQNKQSSQKKYYNGNKLSLPKTRYVAIPEYPRPLILQGLC